MLIMLILIKLENDRIIISDIQTLELLGHKSLKTTEIYTHVSNKDIGKIRSPLDSLKTGDIKK